MSDSKRDDAVVIPRGAAYHPVRGPDLTRTYAFVLVPGFTLLAFSCALEPLRIANQVSQRPLYRWRVLSETGTPVASSSEIPVGVEGSLDLLARDTRALVCAGNSLAAATAPGLVGAIRRHARFGGDVGGICTGAVSLAEAGLLPGRAFTLHWENQPAFRSLYPDLSPSPSRIEISDRIVTCGGGAAATEMMLALIARDHGSTFASIVSDMCLHRFSAGSAQGQRSPISALTGSRHPGFIKVVTLMNDHIDDPLSVAELAQRAGFSRRHIERTFLAVLGVTPSEHYSAIRLDKARDLLTNTDMSLSDVAGACGFQSSSHFGRRFRTRFGVAPAGVRNHVSV